MANFQICERGIPGVYYGTLTCASRDVQPTSNQLFLQTLATPLCLQWSAPNLAITRRQYAWAIPYITLNDALFHFRRIETHHEGKSGHKGGDHREL